MVIEDTDQIHYNDQAATVQHLSKMRPVPANSTPGPHPRVHAPPPPRGKGSQARR
jgi:hypothetical protein